jgi:hypothetical protein
MAEPALLAAVTSGPHNGTLAETQEFAKRRVRMPQDGLEVDTRVEVRARPRCRLRTMPCVCHVAIIAMPTI